MGFKWSAAVSEFEGFLDQQRIIFRQEVKHPFLPEQFREYRNEQIGVRICANPDVWIIEVSDLRFRPDRWYEAAHDIRELIEGSSNDAILPLPEQVAIVQKNWDAMLRKFSPENQCETHAELARINQRNYRRRFPGLFQ